MKKQEKATQTIPQSKSQSKPKPKSQSTQKPQSTGQKSSQSKQQTTTTQPKSQTKSKPNGQNTPHSTPRDTVGQGQTGGHGQKGSFQKFRVKRKIDQISPKLKERLDIKLSDHSNTYKEITAWLNKELIKAGTMLDDEPLQISLSAVGRYALRTKQMSARFNEAREMVREIVRLAKENPDENLNEGALQLAIMGLTEKLATVTFEETSDEKVVELVATISRTKAYKDRVYANIKKDIEKGYDQFLKCITEVINAPNEKAKAKAGRVLLKRYGIGPEQLNMGDDIGSKRLLGLFTEFRKVITNPVPRHKIDE